METLKNPLEIIADEANENTTASKHVVPKPQEVTFTHSNAHNTFDSDVGTDSHTLLLRTDEYLLHVSPRPTDHVVLHTRALRNAVERLEQEGKTIREAMHQHYCVEGKSARSTAAELGIGEGSMKSLLLYYGGSPRNHAQSIKLLWQDEGRKQGLVAKIHTKAADEKRIASLQRHHKDHPDTIANLAASHTARFLQAMTAKFGLESADELRTFIKALTPADRATYNRTRQTYGLTPDQMESVVKACGLPYPKRKSGSLARVSAIDRETVDRARQQGLFTMLLPRTMTVLQARYPITGEAKPHRLIAKELGVSERTVKLDQERGLQLLVKLSSIQAANEEF